MIDVLLLLPQLVSTSKLVQKGGGQLIGKKRGGGGGGLVSLLTTVTKRLKVGSERFDLLGAGKKRDTGDKVGLSPL